jgi:hypothetical protein
VKLLVRVIINNDSVSIAMVSIMKEISKERKEMAEEFIISRMATYMKVSL